MLRSAAVTASLTFSVVGCSAAPVASETLATEEVAVDEVPVASETPTPQADDSRFDYGKTLGNVQIDVEDQAGYTAVIDITLHEGIMASSSEAMPEWCADSFSSDSESITSASSILWQAMEYTVELGDHEGFPEPTDFAPIPEMSISGIEPSSFPSQGKCVAYSTGPEPQALTNEGYEGVSVHAEYGRATPAEPLPTSLEEIQRIPGSEGEIYLNIQTRGECNMRPTTEFTTGAQHNEQFNGPDRNNGWCTFLLTPVA